MEINDVKHTVTAIILNDKNEVLAVSRKDDHNDFGLPGGKVDEEDFFSDEMFLDRFQVAIKREVKEETGLDINPNTMIELLSMPRHMIGKSYWGHSYLVRDWSGEINTDEPHVVKWTTFEELERGCFGPWNTIAKDCLKAIGIEVK
jgi:8-oxo-dGTP pyrophosphatase MutT (NUDIX family)